MQTIQDVQALVHSLNAVNGINPVVLKVILGRTLELLQEVEDRVKKLEEKSDCTH